MIELRHWLAASLLTLTLSGASLARAEDSAGALARQHFKAGSAALESSDFAAAVEEFRAAYELVKCPEVLVILAQVEERRAKPSAAIESLVRYLELAPQGTLAETARARLEGLESTLAEEVAQRPLATASPPGPAEPPAATPSPPSPPPAPFLPRSAALRVPAPPLRPVPKQERPPAFRLPAFIAFGVGGLSASGALAAGLIANGRYNDPANCSSHCDDGHTVSNRTLAVTSGVLAGVAAAGIGAGVVLLLTKPAHSERSNLVPKLRLKVSAERAAAGAVWTF